MTRIGRIQGLRHKEGAVAARSLGEATRKAGKIKHGDRTMDVTCWCDTKTVRVSTDDIAAGRTASCGRPGCQAPE